MPQELARHHAATQQRANDSARLVLRGIALNALLAVVKLAGGIFGHTYALIADAAESMLDILSSSMVLAGPTRTIPTAMARPNRWPDSRWR